MEGLHSWGGKREHCELVSSQELDFSLSLFTYNVAEELAIVPYFVLSFVATQKTQGMETLCIL